MWDQDGSSSALLAAVPRDGAVFTSLACGSAGSGSDAVSFIIATTCDADGSGGAVWRFPLDGGAPEQLDTGAPDAGAEAGAGAADDDAPVLAVVLPVSVALVNDTLYVADAAAGNILKATLSAGRLAADATVVTTVPADEGVPVSVAVDNTGDLWVGLCFGGQVRRVSFHRRAAVCCVQHARSPTQSCCGSACTPVQHHRWCN